MNTGKLMGAGVFSAIAASLCCITPVLALLAGSGSIASTLHWMAPARPYMIAATITLLGVSWYRKLKLQSADDCGCSVDENTRVIQSKMFLAVITVFAILILALPYYAYIFFPNNEKQVVMIDRSDETITFYNVPLVCTAAPEIGCGTRSKPVLLEMERNPSIKEAWLNRAGTVYVIVWAGADRTDEIAKPIFEKYSLDFKRMSNQEAKGISRSFRESGKWYRGADVDKLSIEEAGVIAKDAVTFALNEKLLSEKEASIIKVEIENYLKTELVKVRTMEELFDNEVTKKFTEDLSGVIAKTIGKEQADKITILYMQTNPLEKKGKGSCCETANEADACCKKKRL